MAHDQSLILNARQDTLRKKKKEWKKKEIKWKSLTFVALARLSSMPSGEEGEHPDKVSFIFLTSFQVGSFSLSMADAILQLRNTSSLVILSELNSSCIFSKTAGLFLSKSPKCFKASAMYLDWAPFLANWFSIMMILATFSGVDPQATMAFITRTA